MSSPTSILFLDIDDVLCMNEKYGGYDVIEAIHDRHQDAQAVFREVFSPRACEVLRRVHDEMDGRLRYVISSTWREVLEADQLAHAFRLGGLGFVAGALHERWCTPTALYRGMRVDDIANWLDDRHAGEPFAIVDDTCSGLSLKPALTKPAHPFFGRVVLCEENVGLLPEHIEPLVLALKRPVAPMASR